MCVFWQENKTEQFFAASCTIQIIAIICLLCYWITSNMKIVNCLSFYLLRLTNSYASFYLLINHLSLLYFTAIIILYYSLPCVCSFACSKEVLLTKRRMQTSCNKFRIRNRCCKTASMPFKMGNLATFNLAK